MAQLIYYTNCPACGSAAIKNVLSARDHTVSGETFIIAECTSCSLRFTREPPDRASISAYYKSDNYISHTDSTKGLINRLYQSVRKRTLKQKQRLIEKEMGITKGNLLDVGSGTGAFVNQMKQAGWEVTGLEPDPGARSVGKQLYNIELEDISQFYQLPLLTYDVITLWHVLEHVHELQEYVARLRLLLKENGKLFIAVPNYTSKDAALYGDNWAAYDVPRHLYHFSPLSIQKLMEKHGLRILTYRPMWYDSFYVSLLSSKYKYGKTKLLGSFFNGLRSNLKAMGDAKRCSSVIYIVSLNPSQVGR